MLVGVLGAFVGIRSFVLIVAVVVLSTAAYEKHEGVGAVAGSYLQVWEVLRMSPREFQLQAL